jgi:hypothetical protein
MSEENSGRLRLMKLAAIAIFGAMALVFVFIAGVS